MTHHSRIERKRQRGQLAVITGLIALPLGMIVAMSVELVALNSERARMQAAVDAAALAGASQLAVSGSLAKPSFEYAKDFARHQLQDLSPRLKMTFTAQQDQSGGFVVDAIGSRDSFFGNLVPP
ncbi:pilus assembly protein TadG-related protein, partial [Aquidulcibacter sp.]|uniref:pilus assembly protein TadG-related protein n=1 Tax=Aquidulcibacter sp. TaxID=2052990 RepID=UPI003783EC64